MQLSHVLFAPYACSSSSATYFCTLTLLTFANTRSHTHTAPSVYTTPAHLFPLECFVSCSDDPRRRRGSSRSVTDILPLCATRTCQHTRTLTPRSLFIPHLRFLLLFPQALSFCITRLVCCSCLQLSHVPIAHGPYSPSPTSAKVRSHRHPAPCALETCPLLHCAGVPRPMNSPIGLLFFQSQTASAFAVGPVHCK
jgi:hypothetical protein